MTIGSDQLNAWGKTLIEADNLYRELQLLIRNNAETRRNYARARMEKR